MKRRNDCGFTLVELLVVITILGMIIAPLAGVVLSYVRTSTVTTARLAESHDVQITAAYWNQDVAGMGTRSTSGSNPFTQSIELNVAATGGLYPRREGRTEEASAKRLQ